MKTMYLVEFGSLYSSEPWEPKCICTTETDAKKYIESQVKSRGLLESLYHITELPVFKAKNKK